MENVGEMKLSMELLSRNVRHVQAILLQNCYRDEPPAKLVAVTKTVSPPTIEALKTFGIQDIAENRAQVLVEKKPLLSPDFRIHWIGRLQTNKVKYIIEDVCMIHTLDRMPLAQELDRRASMAGTTLNVLVQVNIASESQKAGVTREEVRRFLKSVNGFSGIAVKGLMAMMPLAASEEQLTEWFRQMRGLFDQLRGEAIAGICMEELSMGMSNDYSIAAREGATMVRVGTALFRM